MTKLKLRLAHLYPKHMNIYGDRGNILCLRRRCEERAIAFQADELAPGDALAADAYDMVFIGGAQDREQRRVAEDLLKVKGAALREAVEGGVTLLAVCGGYQLMGRFYRTAEGEELPGAGVLDIWTVHPGPRARRFIGNVVVKWRGATLVGFENHGGRTHLGAGVRPLGRVVAGFGNNGRDGGEGAVYKNLFGTYLHGSLLPKNPQFADHLIATALARRYGDVPLPPLDDRIESTAHAEAVRLATRRGIIGIGGRK
ncbi:MAG: glutamine amidotransferase [Dehalococcoidia bacterium]|nr:glutamine amidotransferase [Dehalococcoidia bacterium]